MKSNFFRFGICTIFLFSLSQVNSFPAERNPYSLYVPSEADTQMQFGDFFEQNSGGALGKNNRMQLEHYENEAEQQLRQRRFAEPAPEPQLYDSGNAYEQGRREGVRKAELYSAGVGSTAYEQGHREGVRKVEQFSNSGSSYEQGRRDGVRAGERYQDTRREGTILIV